MTVSVILPPGLTLDGVDDVPRAWEGQRAVAVNHCQEGPKEDERRKSYSRLERHDRGLQPYETNTWSLSNADVARIRSDRPVLAVVGNR
jgi:hypothetical protein